MKKETLLVVVVTLVVGVLVGVLLTKGGKGKRQQAQTGAPPASSVNYQAEISALKEVVANDPGARNAWVQLGHKYFDSDQPMAAVEAYNKALEIDPNDPNVLTDQGVMFRRLGWFDRAVENFTKAGEIDPSHLQSLYNLGVVYRYDLQDFPKAIEVWSRWLSLNPGGQGADQLRAEIERLRVMPGAQ